LWLLRLLRLLLHLVVVVVRLLQSLALLCSAVALRLRIFKVRGVVRRFVVTPIVKRQPCLGRTEICLYSSKASLPLALGCCLILGLKFWRWAFGRHDFTYRDSLKLLLMVWAVSSLILSNWRRDGSSVIYTCKAEGGELRLSYLCLGRFLDDAGDQVHLKLLPTLNLQSASSEFKAECSLKCLSPHGGSNQPTAKLRYLRLVCQHLPSRTQTLSISLTAMGLMGRSTRMHNPEGRTQGLLGVSKSPREPGTYRAYRASPGICLYPPPSSSSVPAHSKPVRPIWGRV